MTKPANSDLSPAASPTDIDAILAQRAELKKRDPEAIFLFRVEDEHGDLYRAFCADAHDLAAFRESEAEVAFVGSFGIGHGMHTWAGFPPRMLETVLARIVAAGKRAAVVEQVPRGADYFDDWTVPPSDAPGQPVERVVTDDDDDDDEIRIDEKMGPNQAVDLLTHLCDGPEESHIAADKILCSVLRGLGYPDVAQAFERCKTRNRFWYA